MALCAWIPVNSHAGSLVASPAAGESFQPAVVAPLKPASTGGPVPAAANGVVVAKPPVVAMQLPVALPPNAPNPSPSDPLFQFLQALFGGANNNGGAANGTIPSYASGDEYPSSQPKEMPSGQVWYAPGVGTVPGSFQGKLPAGFNDCSQPPPESDPQANLKCMVCNIYFEARDQSLAGQTEVGRVVLTRVKSPHYPDTICKNVYAYKQFSWTLLLKRPIYMHDQNSIRRAEYAAEQALQKGPNGMDSYYAYSLVNPSWGRSCYPKNILGAHLFCSVKHDDVALGSFGTATAEAGREPAVAR